MTLKEPYRTAGEIGRGGPDPDPGTVPEVSVVIVNWNTRDLLRGCLASIRDQTAVAHEVIVVDNASTDGSSAMVAAEFPEVRLIANTANHGFAGANNQGLAIARGRHLLLLNPDTVILDHAIDRTLVWLAGHPDVGCVGCQVLEGPQTIQRTCFADPSPLNLLVAEMGLMQLARFWSALGRSWYLDWDRRTEREVDVVSGMFMLVPRAVVEKVGLLDDAFFVYAEEADWCRRIREAGWRCVFAPVAQIIHLDGGSKSTSQIRSKMFVQLQKSHLIYARKHHGRAGYLAGKAIFLVSAALRGLFFGALGMIRPSDETRARVRLSRAALRYHLFGMEPVS